MKVKNRPLINPSPEDYKQESSEQLPIREGKDTSSQLELKIDSPTARIRQFISSVKMKVKKNEELFEINILWQTPALPFLIISSLVVVLTLFMGGILNFEKVPPEIPLFYDSIEKHWQQVDKSIVFILPIVLTVVYVLVVQFVVLIFEHDRRLSITISLVLTVLNILLLISISQIYFLIIP